MAAPAIGVRALWTPEPPAAVDGSHPLAQGLVTVFLPAHSVDRRRQWSKVGTPTTGATGFGACRQGFSSSNYFTAADPNLTQASAVNTVVAVAAKTGGTEERLFTERNPTSDFYSLNVTDVLRLSFRPGAGGPVLNTVGTRPVNDGRPHVLGIVREFLSVSLWVDGCADSTGSVGTVAPNTGSTSATLGWPTTSGNAWSGSCNLFAAWNRALGQAEMAMLTADPFCFLRY